MNNRYWGTGNKGANAMSEINPTSPEDVDVVNGKAARMESKSVFGVMAGGNIYTGYFVERVGTEAVVSFGRPYNCRPTTMHGYYKYAPKLIDKVKPPYENLKGQSDICKIFVVLTDWAEPYLVKTAEKNFLNPATNPGVIAYGELEDNKGTDGAYKEFTINIEYRDLDRKPTHVVVVAVASKYADYFTGAIGSVMYVDEFEFGFE